MRLKFMEAQEGRGSYHIVNIESSVCPHIGERVVLVDNDGSKYAFYVTAVEHMFNIASKARNEEVKITLVDAEEK